MPEIKERKPRKSPARHPDVIMASMEERTLMLDTEYALDEGRAPVHTARLRELLDELRRSLRKNGDDDE